MPFIPIFTGDVEKITTEKEAHDWLYALGLSCAAFHLDSDPRDIYLFDKRKGHQHEMTERRAFTNKQCVHLDARINECHRKHPNPYDPLCKGIEKQLGIGEGQVLEPR